MGTLVSERIFRLFMFIHVHRPWLIWKPAQGVRVFRRFSMVPPYIVKGGILHDSALHCTSLIHSFILFQRYQ